MESILDPAVQGPRVASAQPGKGLLALAAGLFSCSGGVLAYLDSGSDRLPPGMAFGVLFLMLAAQYFFGASSEAKSWLGRTIVLMFLADILLEIVDGVRGLTWSRLESQVLLVTGAVMLAVLALWAAYQLGVRSAARRQNELP